MNTTTGRDRIDSDFAAIVNPYGEDGVPLCEEGQMLVNCFETEMRPCIDEALLIELRTATNSILRYPALRTLHKMMRPEQPRCAKIEANNIVITDPLETQRAPSGSRVNSSGLGPVSAVSSRSKNLMSETRKKKVQPQNRDSYIFTSTPRPKGITMEERLKQRHEREEQEIRKKRYNEYMQRKNYSDQINSESLPSSESAYSTAVGIPGTEGPQKANSVNIFSKRDLAALPRECYDDEKIFAQFAYPPELTLALSEQEEKIVIAKREFWKKKMEDRARFINEETFAAVK